MSHSSRESRCGCGRVFTVRLEARNAAGAVVDSELFCGDDECCSGHRAIRRMEPKAVGGIHRVVVAEVVPKTSHVDWRPELA